MRRIILTPDEARAMIYMAVLLHIERLPQMKGKGKTTDQRVRENGIRFFAGGVSDYILRGSTEITQAEQEPHQQPGFPGYTGK